MIDFESESNVIFIVTLIVFSFHFHTHSLFHSSYVDRGGVCVCVCMQVFVFIHIYIQSNIQSRIICHTWKKNCHGSVSTKRERECHRHSKYQNAMEGELVYIVRSASAIRRSTLCAGCFGLCIFPHAHTQAELVSAFSMVSFFPFACVCAFVYVW